ncbi:MAG TPA: DUF3683 domain-containing protein [Rectinemataceae bacterium]|nr:DUF3683 domain-containing protein [Rectinemataceae bacterium]
MRETPREIPYNYTSADDAQVVRFLLGPAAWETLDALRERRVTGRSARLLLRVLGELFLVRRNPYIYDELLSLPDRRRRFAARVGHDLEQVEKRSAGDTEVLGLVRQCVGLVDGLLAELDAAPSRRARVRAALGAVVGQANLHFDPFALISHATDATDWRLRLPFAVVYPTTVEQVAPLLAAISAIGLKAIARGAGTGLTGGAVPLAPDVVVVNTERLNRVVAIGDGDGSFGFLDAEAGCVTETAIHEAKRRGWVFATDPTSSWACTLGGNIAENAGGKTAVLWGTAVDNLLSWRMALSDGRRIVVERLDHPGRKIVPEDSLRFSVRAENGASSTVELRGSELRKEGLWKDITNKALSGLPGLQKEGTDGVITGARFILYRPYERKTTICLEFFGDDMEDASRAILEMTDEFANHGEETLMALEHFDEEYVEAVEYRAKASRGGRPKAVLLVDLVAHDEVGLARGISRMKALLAPHAGTEAFYARDESEAEEFWAVRKKLGAIARHTNAFKLNEDVVLPLPRLADFAAFVDSFNLDEERRNQREIAVEYKALLAHEAKADPSFTARVEAAEPLFVDFEAGLGSVTRERLRAAGPAVALRDALIERFAGHAELEAAFREAFSQEQARLIKVATHMHAGDGNVHCNIPVFSNDRAMMARAHAAADRVMREAVRLGGVVSGEHGIGVTKMSYLEPERVEALDAHRASYDPEGIMSPGALRDPDIMERVFTPSFNLLGLEARILQHDRLAVIAGKIQSCIRCGKCKPDCCVNIPEKAMFYHPRNKNLAIASVIEAILYDSQRSRSADFAQLAGLGDVADHCTVCHKCQKPCPVEIDTGEVSLLEREILKARGLKRTSPATRASLAFLAKGDDKVFQAGFRFLVLGAGMRGQRLASRLAMAVAPLKARRETMPVALLASPMPKAKGLPLQLSLPRHGERQAFFVAPPRAAGRIEGDDADRNRTVFYFPGCGSERLHGAIGRASLYILLKSGAQVVLPPTGMCCSYPFAVNGRAGERRGIELRNAIVFGQIRDMFAHLEFDAVVLSCGTCKESLGSMDVRRVFGAPLKDVSAWALEEGLELGQGLGNVMYHKPCHDSLDGEGGKLIAAAKGVATSIPHCCGEAGTLALSRPDISVHLHDRKAEAIAAARRKKPELKTLIANCPSCIQGLGRHEGQDLEVKHLAVALAEAAGGTAWESELEGMLAEAEVVTF